MADPKVCGLASSRQAKEKAMLEPELQLVGSIVCAKPLISDRRPHRQVEHGRGTTIDK